MQLKHPEDYQNILTTEDIEVLRLIAVRPEYADCFFKTKSDLKWFWPLKSEGYFEVKRAPNPIPAQEKGYYTTPQWEILDYLVKVSKQLGKLLPDERVKIETELIRIIKETTALRGEYLRSNPESLEGDNYRTWYGFVQILQNLGKSSIDNELAECFGIWMRSAFNAILHGSELGKKILPLYLNPEGAGIAEKISRALLDYRVISQNQETTVFEFERKIVSRLEKYWIADVFLKRKYAYELGKHCSAEFIVEVAANLRKMLSVRRARRFDFGSLEGKTYSLVLFLEDLGKYSRYILAEREPVGPREANVFKRDSLKPIADIAVAGVFSGVSSLEQFISVAVSKHLQVKWKPETKEVAEFYSQLSAEYSSIWVESLYDDFESGYEDSLSVYVYVLRELLAGKAEMHPDDVAGILLRLCSEEFGYVIFKRLALYCIGKSYGQLKSLFWQQILKAPGFNLLEEYELKPEVHQLLVLNAKQFLPDELQSIEDAIEAGPQMVRELPLTVIQVAYWKEEWYSALGAIDKYQQKYSELKERTKTDVQIPHRVESWSGPGGSPLSKEDLQVKPNKELTALILSFIEERRDFSSRITSEGLAETLVSAVKDKPHKFVEDIDVFLPLPYRFVYSILDGVYEAYKAGATDNLSWAKVFSFVELYVDRDAFWNDSLLKGDSDVRRAGHEWVVGKVSEIIRGVTANDERAIVPEYNVVMARILLKILNRLQSESGKVDKDPVIHYLNSPEGKATEALLNLSLRIARLNQEKCHSPLWDSDLKAAYEKLLQSRVYDAYTVLGRFLANYHFLDSKWTEVKISELSKLDGAEWNSFVIGYLSSHHIYNNLYALMRPIYEKAISHVFDESRAKESLAQHIAIGYLRGLDKLGEGSLLALFLDKESPEVIERLLGFIWMQRIREEETDLTGTPEKQEKKKEWLNSIIPLIIALWRHIYRQYQKNYKWGEEYKVANAELAKWAVFLREIDEENYEWLLYAAKYLSDTVDSSFFIEYLTRLKDTGDPVKNSKYIGTIWEQLLEKFTPDYKVENVQDILAFIKGNDKMLGEKLIEKYVERRRSDIVEAL